MDTGQPGPTEQLGHSSAVEAGMALRSEAHETDERRLLVLAGSRDLGYDAAAAVLEETGVAQSAATLVGPADRLGLERVSITQAQTLLGTTNDAIVVDLHESLRPNTIGATVGAVDGGGLYILLTPPLADWPSTRDCFDERIAAPPFSVTDVTGHFRKRFVRTLHRCAGVAIVDVDDGTVIDDGLTNPAPVLEPAIPDRSAVGGQLDDDPHVRASRGNIQASDTEDWGDTGRSGTDVSDKEFPSAAYEHARTADQREAVAALETLTAPEAALVVQADRGRGKSSAAGLAAGALAAAGECVLVTAPTYRNAAAVFERARELLDDEGVLVKDETAQSDRTLRSTSGGEVQFRDPTAAVELVDNRATSEDPQHPLDPSAIVPDVVLVDEAAALPVRRLEALASADRVAFATTTYGYEGMGRGFSVRFRDSLEELRENVVDVRLDEPIRFAPGDPVETWAFDALLLNASPVPGCAIEDASPGEVKYEQLDPATLAEDDARLRMVFGLLVLAHYRTEPDDLARLLDAPNVAIRTLTADDQVVGVAMLAREGGLAADTRAAAYDGERIHGNMLPDVLTTQLRDEDAGRPVGARVVRIATHPAVRNRGLGAALLDRLADEADAGFEEWADAPEPADPTPGEGLDWVGVGYGATPRLVRFWARNGYQTVHCSTTRNDRSGEHSVLMLSPTSPSGQALLDRTTERFARRIGAVCAGPLADANPAVLAGALSAVDATKAPLAELTTLTDWEWTVVASASYGPGIAAVAPGAFRRLAVAWLIADNEQGATGTDQIDEHERRLLVRGAIQGHEWETIADELSYPSKAPCLRAFADAFKPIVDTFGNETAQQTRDRYTDDSSQKRNECCGDEE